MSLATPELAAKPAASPARKAVPGLFAAEDYFALRAPLMPVSRWLAGGASAADRAASLASLRALWDDARVREAVLLASSSLHERLSGWDWNASNEKGAKLAQALYRYVARMCTRPTPFGLFASLSVGREGAVGGLDLDAASRLRRHTRLDTSTVAALGEKLARDPALRPRLRVRRNDCGHAVGDRWHYVEWELKSEVRRYTLSSVAASEYLDVALRCADGDGCDIEAIVAALCAADAEIERADALEFIDSLIDSRLLVPTLEPCVTGRECLPVLIDELAALAPDAPGLPELGAARDRLAALDAADLGQPAATYDAVADALAPLDANLRRDRLFQVDLYRDVEGLRLPPEVLAEVARAAEAFVSLGAWRNGPLDDFARRFAQRYEERRVPLLDVLDEETGIGSGRAAAVPSALLDGVAWSGGGEAAAGGVRGDALMLARWHDAIARGVDEIVLDAKDLPTLSDTERAGVPHSLAAMATLLAPDAAALAQGDYAIVMHSVWGPSAINLLGRFCFGDGELAECARASLRAESASEPDAVFAEIVHLPQERLGNVVCRPLLRDYEIPVLGRSGAPADRRIALDDLDVEVQGRSVRLYSRRLGKRVIPRMSNAHNYGADTLGVYRFLCQVQYQESVMGGFSWGSQLGNLPRLPRLRHGRVVLAPAQWQVKADGAKALVDADDAARCSAAAAWRQSLGLPRLVGIVEFDNVLAIDFDNPVAVDTLVDALKQKRALTLIELNADPAQLCVGRDGDRYAHEIVLPLKRASAPAGASAQESNPRQRELRKRYEAKTGALAVDAAQRCRLPGSDWLYYRVYGGASVLDRVLVDRLAPLADALRTDGACADWFYIRYADPDWHLRLRLTGDPARLAGEAMPRLADALAQLRGEGSIVRVDIGSYDREIERYGGLDGMALCERWFAQDSRLVANLLRELRGAPPAARWQLAAAALVRGLGDFGLDAEARADLFAYQAGRFLDEFSMRKQRLATLGNKYREFSGSLQAICAGALPEGLPDPAAVAAALDADALERRRIGDALRETEAAGKLHGTVASVLPSLVHMSCNRWFTDNGRAHEMVLYELIRRGCEAVRARARSGA